MKPSRLVPLGLSVAMLVGLLAGCGDGLSSSTVDEMAGVTPLAVGDLPMTEEAAEMVADWSVSLLQEVVSGSESMGNIVLAPAEVQRVLAIAATGARGETLSQIEAAIGSGQAIGDISRAVAGFTASLSSSESATVEAAASVWCNSGESVTIDPVFLQTVSGYFGADVYRSDFGPKTVDDINTWVKRATDGMVSDLISQLGPDLVAVLLTALSFDAAWAEPYSDRQVVPGAFLSASGLAQETDFLQSAEMGFLDDGSATGFVKPYGGGAYDFVALLPDEGLSLRNYLMSLDGESFRRTLRQAQETPVVTALPQFSSSTSLDLVQVLQAMGIIDAFLPGRADFSGLGRSDRGPLYVDQVVQRASIEVTPAGTRAGAATAVTMSAGAAPIDKTVILDRPFLYAIVDHASEVPIFMGVMTSVDREP